MENCQNSVEVYIRLQPPEKDHLFALDNQILSCAGKQYCFDHIFKTMTTQEEIYTKIGLKAIANSKKGYNSCIFVYGQTGSGKTYTMTGSSSQAGLVQRFIQQLWSVLQEFQSFELRMSYFQIYNEQVNDLMAKKKKIIKIKESLNLGFYLENLEEVKIEEEDDIINYLEKGIKNRTTAQTKMNKESSRSHSIFTLLLTTRQLKENSQAFSIKTCKIHFVDLAGSEKQKSTQAAGNRLKQASSINKSLTALSIVIQKLSSKSSHIPYRDSVLTKILRDSLGGNSKTILVATLSSSQSAISETISTLNFASKAKKVKLAAKINEEYEGSVSNMRKMIQSLQQQLKIMKTKEKICDACISLRRDYEQLEKRCLEAERELNFYKQFYEQNKKEFQVKKQAINSEDLEYELTTIAEANEKTTEQKTNKNEKNFNLEIEQYKMELIAAESEISLYKNEISKLNQQIMIQERADIDHFSPLLARFTQNLNKLRINECLQEIQLSLFYKINVTKKKLENSEQKYKKQQQIYHQQIQYLKQKIKQLHKAVNFSQPLSQAFSKSSREDELDYQNKELSENILNLKELLRAQKKNSKELIEQNERIEIMYNEVLKKMQNLNTLCSQQAAQLQESQDVVKFWEDKHNKLWQQLQIKNEQWEDSQRANEIYRKNSSQQQIYYKEMKKQFKDRWDQLKGDNSKKKKEIEKLKNMLSSESKQKFENNGKIQKLEAKVQILMKENAQKEAMIIRIQEQIWEKQRSLNQKHSQEKRDQERLKENFKITTAQFNKILQSKQEEMNSIAKEASDYYLRCSELAGALKQSNLKYEQLQAEYQSIQDKLRRAEKKYKDLRTFIKDEQTVSFQDLHKLQEQNSLLRDNLSRFSQRIQLMKEQNFRKTKQVEELREELKREKKWVKDFTRFKRQVLTQKQSHPEQINDKKKRQQILEERDLRWEVGQAKIELVSLVEKLCKVLKVEDEGVQVEMEQQGNSNKNYNLLQKINEIQNWVERIENIKIENQKLIARNRYLSEKRNSDFISTLPK